MIELTPDEHKILVDAIQDSATVVHKGRKDMNERIKQLMEQAGLYDFVIESMGINEEMEKFAELIVRECIDTAFHRGHPDLEFLLKHFGVEE